MMVTAGVHQSAQPAPVSFDDRSLPDASAQARAQDWLEIECCQIDSGPFGGSITQLGLAGAGICREAHERSVHKRGRMPDRWCTISVAVEAGADGWFLQERLPHDGSVFLLPGGTEFDVYVPGPTRTLYIVLDQEELLAGLRALDPGGWEQPPDRLLALESPRRGAFIHTLHTLLELFRWRPAAVSHHRALRRTALHNALLVLGGAGPAIDGTGIDGRARRRKVAVVRRARDYMHGCIENRHNPTIVDVCAHAGVSERTLEYCFRDLLRVTPVAYLRILRLNRVRRNLLHCHPLAGTVTDAAMRYGFLHLGAFARDYHRQFGELPSATLARPPQ